MVGAFPRQLLYSIIGGLFCFAWWARSIILVRKFRIVLRANHVKPPVVSSAFSQSEGKSKPNGILVNESQVLPSILIHSFVMQNQGLTIVLKTLYSQSTSWSTVHICQAMYLLNLHKVAYTYDTKSGLKATGIKPQWKLPRLLSGWSR